MKLLSLLFILFFFPQTQTPPQFISIESKANQTVSLKGNIADGDFMPDMSFAWNSSVACFTAIEKDKYSGKQLLYTTLLPSYSEMEVKVIPKNKRDNFSIYAYQTGIGPVKDIQFPPARCVRCEVEHQWDRPFAGKTQDHTRTAKNLLALKNPYRVVIGVVGAEGLTEGEFTLEVTMKSY